MAHLADQLQRLFVDYGARLAHPGLALSLIQCTALLAEGNPEP